MVSYYSKANISTTLEQCPKWDITSLNLAYTCILNKIVYHLVFIKGLRVEEYQVPDRRGAIFLFDFNKPKDGVQQVKLVWNDEKIETLNPHGISTFITKSGKGLKHFCSISMFHKLEFLY